MRFLKTFSLVVLLFAVFNSCKNDLKVNAPYKEIPTIYAVLNPNETEQVIRINKVFLGEGDANKMAKVADSVNYGQGELTVTLDRFVNGVQVDVIESKKIRTLKFDEKLIQTNPGAFSTTQRVYYTNEDLKNPDPKDPIKKKAFGDYVLTVKNIKTGNIFKAKATAFDSIIPQPPFSAPYYPIIPGSPESFQTDAYLDYSNAKSTQQFPYSIRYNPNEAKIYNLSFRFYFYEDFGIQGQVERFVDYNFNNQQLKDATSIPSTGGKSMVNTFFGRDLFSNIGLSLSKMNLNDIVIGRKMFKMQFFVYSSTQEYLDYLSFSAPSFNISQNKPQYSNFENRAAMGIFTFRTRCTVVKEMSAPFVNEFAYNANTCKYKFKLFDNSVPGCK